MSDQHAHQGHTMAGHGSGHTHGDAAELMATDPVCGMKVDPQTSKHHAEHGGALFHFCSVSCRTKFIAEPERYLAPKIATPPAPAPAAGGAIYTCLPGILVHIHTRHTALQCLGSICNGSVL